jgi:hypothetical protein
LPSTSVHAGRAAEEAALRKVRKYDFLVPRFLFVPVAVETSGMWDAAGLRWVREIGLRLAVVTGERRSTTFLLQRISLAIVRGNVAAILGTLPRGQAFDEVFLL